MLMERGQFAAEATPILGIRRTFGWFNGRHEQYTSLFACHARQGPRNQHSACIPQGSKALRLAFKHRRRVGAVDLGDESKAVLQRSRQPYGCIRRRGFSTIGWGCESLRSAA